MARRCTTKRPKVSHHKCHYFFVVNFNDSGFHVVSGVGNTTHSFHTKLGKEKCNLPLRLLDKVTKNFVSDMSDGNAANSIIRNVIFAKTG